MEACAEAIGLCADYARKGSRMALSDAGCGAAIARGALQAASLNVFINTKSMADRAQAAAFDLRADELIARANVQAQEVLDEVTAQLRG